MKYFQSLLVILCIATHQFGLCQPISTNPGNPGDSLINEGNIREAIQQYSKFYVSDPGDMHNLYNYACALSAFGLNDSCFKYLYKYLEMDTSIAILVDPDFLTIRKDPRWNDLENKLISMIGIKNKNTFKDIEYAKILWNLSARDQAYFREIGIAGRKIGMNSSVQRALWELKFMISQENQKELSFQIEKKGWPKISDVGTEAADAAFLVIQHSDLETQKKYIPLLKEQCEQKEASWINYAFLYDRIQTSENKPQKYGTQFRWIEKNNSIELFPLENEKKVNEWRKEVGLEPLEGY